MNTLRSMQPHEPRPSLWWLYGPVSLLIIVTGLLLWSQGCSAEPQIETTPDPQEEPQRECKAPPPEQVSMVISCAESKDCEEPIDPCRERWCGLGNCQFRAKSDGSFCRDGWVCLDGECCEKVGP